MRTLDSLILDTAAGSLALARTVLVCDDPTGDLERAALGTGARVLLLDSDYTRCQAAADGVDVAGDTRLDEFLAGASVEGPCVAIGEMPKSLGRVDYLAASIAAVDTADVTVVFGGNNKHLSRSMNETLASSFTDVAASRGRGKFRCLVASGPRDVAYEPRRADGFVAFGGVFSGAKEDRGGAMLRRALPAELGRFLDLGCGNGSVSRGLEGAVSVTATDSDADAVLSARAIGIDATWDDAGARFEDASFDTIALNPPFHNRAAVDATQVQHLLDAAARLLAPGGQLFMVHNSHLRYRGEVERLFSAVEQVARDATFTVLRAVR